MHRGNSLPVPLPSAVLGWLLAELRAKSGICLQAAAYGKPCGGKAAELCSAEVTFCGFTVFVKLPPSKLGIQSKNLHLLAVILKRS